MPDASIAETTAGSIKKIVLADPVSGEPYKAAGGTGGGDASAANQLTEIARLEAVRDRLPSSLDNSKLSTIPAMTTGGNVSAQTTALGTTYQAFGSQACKQLTVSNQTGTTIEVQQGGTGVGFEIPTGAMMPFYGLSNANALGIRRKDQATTQVTVTARWES